MTDQKQFDGYKKLLALAQANPVKHKLRAAMLEAGMSFENEGLPWSGYYRLAEEKGGPLLPVAIWRDDDGELLILWGANEARPDRVWPSCAMNPVSYEYYEAKMAPGGEWPDIHVITAAEPEEERAADWREGDKPIPPAGDNAPPKLSESDEIKIEIENAAAGVKDYAKIESDEVRDKSQSLRSRLLELARTADNRRKALVRPHVDAQREINGTWNPLVDNAQAAADKIKSAQEAWATKKLKARQAEEAKVAEERRKTEEAARAAAAAAEAAGKPVPPPPPPPPEPERVAPVTSFRGGYGRASSEKPVEVITEVTDYTALFNYFRNDSDVKDLLLKKARKVLKDTGDIPPGVKTETQAKVA